MLELVGAMGWEGYGWREIVRLRAVVARDLGRGLDAAEDVGCVFLEAAVDPVQDCAEHDYQESVMWCVPIPWA